MCLRVAVAVTTNAAAVESAPGNQVDKRNTVSGSAVLGTPGPPRVPRRAWINRCCCFVRRDSPISQPLVQAGPQVLGDSAEAVGSGRAPTCTQTLIPHTGGDLSRAGKSSPVIEWGV